MKTLHSLLLLGVIATSLFTACGNKDNTAPAANNTSNTTSSFSATVDGKAFNADKVRAEMQGGLLSLAATSGKQGFVIFLVDVKVGANPVTFSFAREPNEEVGGIIYSPDTTAEDYGYSGNTGDVINITAINTTDKTISGNFALTMTDSAGKKITVTAGVFNVKYTSKGGEVSYKLDGTAHTGQVFTELSYEYITDSTGSVKDSVARINMASIKNTYPKIHIGIPQALAVGTYNLNDQQNALVQHINIYLMESSSSFGNFFVDMSKPATVIITANDIKTRTLVGSFNATMQGYDEQFNTVNRVLTEGKFNVTY